MNNQMINDNFEEASGKDSVYLQAEQRVLMQQIMQELSRLEATIQILDPDKILTKNEKDKSQILPF